MKNLQFNALTLFGAMLAVLGTGAKGQAIVTFGASGNNLVTSGNYSGVVSINNQNSQFCTGSLLTGGLYILTAAHCIADGTGKFNTSLLNNTTVNFNLGTSIVYTPVAEFYVHPEYDGNVFRGNDIALLKLSQPAPSGVQQYDIYRQGNEVGQIFTSVGYGVIGTGNTGEKAGSNVPSLAYFGQNSFDALGDIFNPVWQQQYTGFAGAIPGSQLVYDFDNGTPANDALGVHFGIKNLGLGNNEVAIGRGDSGGPAFINNLIAGIASYGFSDTILFPSGPKTDIDAQQYNSSFGEFLGSTRVSFYTSFIDSFFAKSTPVGGSTGENLVGVNTTPKVTDVVETEPKVSVPESSSMMGLLGLGAIALTSWRRKQKF